MSEQKKQNLKYMHIRINEQTLKEFKQLAGDGNASKTIRKLIKEYIEKHKA